MSTSHFFFTANSAWQNKALRSMISIKHNLKPNLKNARAHQVISPNPQKNQKSMSSSSHHASENMLSILQLRDAILQKFPVLPRIVWLRRNSFHLRIRQTVDDDWVEDILEASNDMSLDDLCGYIGDENLLHYLDDRKRKSVRYVDCRQNRKMEFQLTL